MQKYSDFKALGESVKWSHFEVFHSIGKEVTFDLESNELSLKKKYIFGNTPFWITFHENGKLEAHFSHSIASEVKMHEGEFCLVDSISFPSSFARQNGIITSLQKFDETTHKVKFGKIINFDFSDFPESITKYFLKPSMNIQNDVMFVDLDVEMI